MASTPDYVFWLPALTIAAYIVSYALAYFGKISVPLHRKIWNAFLFLSAFTVALTGVQQYLFYFANINFVLPFDVFSVHGAAGLVFVIIAIFHAAWHFPYFKAYLPKGKKEGAVPPAQ